jgi:hypothetical protein
MRVFAPILDGRCDFQMSEDHKHILKLIVQQEHQKAGPDLKLDKFFELFSAEQVLKSRGFDVDYEQLLSGNVGGDTDGGVDGLYCFVNHVLIAEDSDVSAIKGRPTIELLVVQSTMHAGFAVSHIQKFADFTKRCLRLPADHSQYTALYSARVLGLCDKFRKVYEHCLTLHPVVNIRFVVATLGDQVDVKVKTQAQEFEAECNDYFHGAKVEVLFFGADKLLTWSKREIEKTLPLTLAEAFSWKAHGTGYVGVVRLPDFYSFISDDGVLREHLFESNVRDFQGHSIEVNKGIKRTLELKEPHEFWWLNNGVTVLASHVEGDKHALALTEPLIVNGLQTSFVIYDYFSSGLGSKDDERTILVRIVKADDTGAIDKIIGANNSQTPIPKPYLYASDDVQRNIESIFKMNDLFYDRRKNYYRRRGTPVAKIITPAYLAQSIAALVLHRPDDARGRATTLFARDYKKLFSNHNTMPLYVNCARIMKRTEAYLATKSIENTDQQNLKWHLAMYVTALHNKSALPQRTKLAKLADASVIPGGLYDYAFDAVWPVYADLKDALGDGDKVAKGPELLKRLKSKLSDQFDTKNVKDV